jgi:hypothetical protein
MKMPRRSRWARRRGRRPWSGGGGFPGGGGGFRGDGGGGGEGKGAAGPTTGPSRGQLILGFVIIPLAFLSIPFFLVATIMLSSAVSNLW